MQIERSLVVVTFNDKRPVDLDRVRRLLGEEVEVSAIDMPHRPWSRSEEDRFVVAAGTARSILLRPGYLSRPLLLRLPRLETVSIHGTGLNQVDVDTCNERGIIITNAPGGNAAAVAEHAFGMLIALQRRILWSDRLVREGRWSDAVFTGHELQDKILGIVGLGNVGMRVARIAHGFGMMTIGYDPGVSAPRFREAGVVPVSLDSLLAEADMVTLHVPLLADTKGLLDARRLARMKPTAVLINTARGGLVDEPALIAMLAQNSIAGAALDVFAEEPLSADHPLLKLQNVVLTPHSAAQTHEVAMPIIQMICEDISRVYAGQSPKFVANPRALQNRGASERPR